MSRPDVRTLPAIDRTVERIESEGQLDPLARNLRRAAEQTVSDPVGATLRGEWLGHALHPLLSDVPIGCWVSASVVDLIGGRSGRRAARRLVGLGVLAALPTAAAGLAEVPDIREPRTLRVAAVHATGNAVATAMYVMSWRQRRRGHHLRGVAWGLAGGAAVAVSGYLGGHLAFARHVGSGER